MSSKLGIPPRKQNSLEPYQRVALLAAIVGFGFLVYFEYRDHISRPGFKVSAPHLGNYYAVGYAWGLIGVLIPLGVGVVFWTGLGKVWRHQHGWSLGLFLTFLVLSPAAYGAFSYLLEIRRVWHDDLQRRGFTAGTFAAIFVATLIPVLWMIFANSTVPQIHNRAWFHHMQGRKDLVTGPVRIFEDPDFDGPDGESNLEPPVHRSAQVE